LPRGQQIRHAIAVAVHRERQRETLGAKGPGHAVAHQSRGADESDALHEVFSRGLGTKRRPEVRIMHPLSTARSGRALSML
jgi:hypothetical protein